MSVDLALRTFGTLVCLYSFAFLVTSMSLSAIETAGLPMSGPTCAPSDCRAVAIHHPPSLVASANGQDGFISAAAMIVSGF